MLYVFFRRLPGHGGHNTDNQRRCCILGQFVQAAVANGYEGSCTIGTTAPSWIAVNPLSFTAREFFQEHKVFNLIIEANQGAERIGTVTLGNATVTVIQSGSPDLSISNAEGNVIQTVIGAEAFVADKSTVVTVTIRATQPDLLPTSGVTLDVFFDNRVERVTVPKSDFFRSPQVSRSPMSIRRPAFGPRAKA